MCLHSKGQYHLASGEGTEAEAALREALRIAELVYGPSHLQVRSLLKEQLLSDGLVVLTKHSLRRDQSCDSCRSHDNHMQNLII